MLVCVILCAFCTRDRGCSVHPAFPAPSLLHEGGVVAKLGRECAARTRRCVSTHAVIARSERDEAIQSRLHDSGLYTVLDRFAFARNDKALGDRARRHLRTMFTYRGKNGADPSRRLGCAASISKDEELARQWRALHPHGEEARSAVSNHELCSAPE
jgi:hypothetical protein